MLNNIYFKEIYILKNIIFYFSICFVILFKMLMNIPLRNIRLLAVECELGRGRVKKAQRKNTGETFLFRCSVAFSIVCFY